MVREPAWLPAALAGMSSGRFCHPTCPFALPVPNTAIRIAITDLKPRRMVPMMNRKNSLEGMPMREAEDALHRWLADGPVEVEVLKKLAGEAGVGWRTVERAKRCLRVKTEKRRGPGNKNGPWMWRLSEDRQPGAVAAFSGGQNKSRGSASQRTPPPEDRQTALADMSVWEPSDWGSGWGESLW